MSNPYAYPYSPIEGSSTGVSKWFDPYLNILSHDALIYRFIVTTLSRWIGWL